MLRLYPAAVVAPGNSTDSVQRDIYPCEQRQNLPLELAAAGSLFVIQLLTFATYQLDIWVGGALLEPDELGLFGVAKRCQLLAQIPVQMAMMTVISTVPRLRVQNRMLELEGVIRRAATLAAIPSLAALALLAIYPQWILNVLFGGSYLGAAPVILPLVVGRFAHVVFGNPAYVLDHDRAPSSRVADQCGGCLDSRRRRSAFGSVGGRARWFGDRFGVQPCRAKRSALVVCPEAIGGLDSRGTVSPAFDAGDGGNRHSGKRLRQMLSHSGNRQLWSAAQSIVVT